jgi:hypothetical protein
MKKKRFGIGLCISLLVMGAALPALAVLSDEEIPDALTPWRSWVLHGQEERLCPGRYDGGASARCQWPARLDLSITEDGGDFEQSWLIYAKSWVPLPGGLKNWPDAVAVNGRPTAVINRDGRPMVSLSPGEYDIVGRFFWRHPPEMLQVPPSLGLLSLTLMGRTVPSPRYDEQGRLWLQSGDTGATGQTSHRVQVFRLFSDAIPVQVTTVLKLDVSGPGRELVFENILMAGGIAMALESRLPARIESSGRLVVQARAGQWEVIVKSRLPGPVLKIDAGPSPFENEIWSFQSMHHLRMVELAGLPRLEPTRTQMPSSWHRWPAFKVTPDGALAIKEIRRGDPDPAPDQLQLHRIWWLDFDGGGFTIHDRLSGTISRQWFLAMRDPFQVGRVAVDGEDRVITRQKDQDGVGVELRHGRLDLQADSRLPLQSVSQPAVGWNHDMEQVSGVLNMPPGWRLLATTGVDQVSDSWIQRWTLLDFFLMLIISMAVFRLRSWPWGLAALGAMTLIFHEPGAPRLVWLHILAVMALLPLLPSGWFRRLVKVWGLAAGVALVLILIPFMVNQMRWAFYPQLAPVYSRAPAVPFGAAKTAVQSAPTVEMDMDEMVMTERADKRIRPKKAMVSSLYTERIPEERLADLKDPGVLIPTGPGLPDWQWRSVTLNWSGPVSSEQHIRLFLLNPAMNLLLCLLRVGLLAALVWGLFDWRPWWHKIKPHAQAAAVITAAISMLAAGAARAGDNCIDGTPGFPPPALLETLKQRLLEPPDCLPRCADISRLELTVADDQLQLMLKVHAARLTAVPLPVNHQSWIPDQIFLDNAPISGLSRDQGGQLWGLVSAGLHTVVIVGDISHSEVLRIPLPLKPHAAGFSAPGWEIKGIQPDGEVGASVQLIRLKEARNGASFKKDGPALPVFLNVKRRLQLGLTWRVTTTVSRVTPVGSPVVVSIPLLDQESVITEELPTARNEALVTLAADQRTFTYHSTLDIRPDIRLMAPKSVPWTETWILDASPVWHCDLEGIAVIHHMDPMGRQPDQAGTWQPQWQPWPGEQVVIHVNRPQAVEGQQVTIDRADAHYVPGLRFAKGELTLQIRTSRGEQYTMELPPKANLQKVTVDGKSLPVRQDNTYVTIPLRPGAQTIHVQWHQPVSLSALLKTPVVALGHPAVNAHVSVRMPANRWILFVGGPRWGPAVLLWSYLAVIILTALALGRVPLIPLKWWHWMLLGLGLTQIPPAMSLVIVGWLLVLAVRERRPMPARWLAHNTLQLGLVIWTLAALICMFAAVKAGLVGQPDMQIQGNQSYVHHLNWTQDRIDGSMPQPWVLSLPVWIYRVLMLAWSLWLAWSILGWLKWGWRCFSANGTWRKIPRRRPRET